VKTKSDLPWSQIEKAAHTVRGLPSATKNDVLMKLATELEGHQKDILAGNALDLARLPAKSNSAFRDRLFLNATRINEMAKSLRFVASLPDPVGEVVEQKTLPNGLLVRRVRSPLGVLFLIFESRPNVITEAFALAFKAGNFALLRGGSESSHTAKVLYRLLNSVTQKAFGEIGCYAIENYDRDLVKALLKRSDLIDVTIPRGGEKLIQFVQKHATMPIIKNDRGLCHAYIDASANLTMGLEIVMNGKVQRPAVCNSLETVLIHESVAVPFLESLAVRAGPENLTLVADPKALRILKKQKACKILTATQKSFSTEYLDLFLNCRIVPDLKTALDHIAQYGSKHSETIVTETEAHARQFQAQIDCAAVYWNASTRFTDGFQLGLGGEMGISTQKLHVRGPVGLRELTSVRWIIDGTGQIR